MDRPVRDTAADVGAVLKVAAEHAAAYRASLPDRPVRARLGIDDVVAALGGDALPTATPPGEVLERLV
jgi:hypothetical protein